MEKEDTQRILKIVEEARSIIGLAQRCNDGRKRDRQIREAKIRAQEIVSYVEPQIRSLCSGSDIDGMDDLFTWGILERDLDNVHGIISNHIQQIND